MTTPNFTIPYGPTFPVEREKSPRLNLSTFGDGYEQASGDGINIIKPVVPVGWEGGLTKAEADAADAFLESLGGQLPFLWIYPGDSVPTAWVCRKWKHSMKSTDNYGFSGEFIRYFGPGYTPPSSPPAVTWDGTNTTFDNSIITWDTN